MKQGTPSYATLTKLLAHERKKLKTMREKYWKLHRAMRRVMTAVDYLRRGLG